MVEPDQIYASLAYAIRHWRLDAGMSQEATYRAARLSKNVYIGLEQGRGVYSAAQLEAIASIYGRRGWQLSREASLLLDSGELPELPHTVREWHKYFG